MLSCQSVCDSYLDVSLVQCDQRSARVLASGPGCCRAQVETYTVDYHMSAMDLS